MLLLRIYDIFNYTYSRLDIRFSRQIVYVYNALCVLENNTFYRYKCYIMYNLLKPYNI